MIKFLVLLLLVSPIICKDYTSYKVFEVTAIKNQIDQLQEWENQKGIDFWTSLRLGHPTKIMVAPEKQNNFMNFLETNAIQHKLVVPDVEEMLKIEKADHENHRRLKRNVNLNSPSDAKFDYFWTFDEMEDYAKLVAQTYPNIVKLDNIGETIEGRSMFGLRFSNSLSSFGEKPIIFIDAGTHSREWASQASALYLIHQLATSEYSQELLEKIDWVVVPNVNPDGYVYSQTEDRLWRKNRRQVNFTCLGVDLNRNYAYEWQQVPNSCPTTGYPGASPLSEPETAAVAHYMESFNHNLRLYVATHSYGPLVLWPFGYQMNLYISNWREHDYVGKLFVDAVNRAGNKDLWVVGNSADILYTANGASDDFSIAYGKSRLAFTVELPPGPSGFHSGFEYPQDMIESLVKHVFMGYRAMGLYVAETYYR